MQRDEEAREIYAYAVRTFVDKPDEQAKGIVPYANVLKKLGGLNFNADKYVILFT
jgi:hypothetical protein